MGICFSDESQFNPTNEDVERWRKKKLESKVNIVPKVNYTPVPLSSEARKASASMATNKRWVKDKTQDEKRKMEADDLSKEANATSHTSKAQEVLWIPHRGIASYKELSEEFGTKNKKALIRMASEAHLKKTGGDYSTSNAEKAANANEKMNRSKSAGK